MKKYVLSLAITLCCMTSPFSVKSETKCHAGAMSFAPCEQLVSQRLFTELILAFPDGDFAPTKLGRLARFFYRGVGFFGLFVKEKAVTNRCVYLNQSEQDLSLFIEESLDFIRNSSDQIVFDWILRANIYLGELKKTKNCVRAPLSEFALKKIVERVLKRELEQMILDDDKRYRTFERVYARLKDIVSITSDILNKIATFETQMKMVDFKINKENGTITVLIERWSKLISNSGEDGPISETDQLMLWLQGIQKQYLQINISDILNRWEELKQANKDKAELIIGHADRAPLYYDLYFTDNSKYQQLKSEANQRSENLSVGLDRLKTTKRDIKKIYQKIYAQSCVDDAHYWWCK